MKREVIAFTYDGYENEKKHLIDCETDQYYYMTDGWTGEEKRYHKTKKTLEFKDQNDNWQLYSDWQSIVQVDVY